MKKQSKEKPAPLYYEGNVPIYLHNPVQVSFRHDHYRHLVRHILTTRISMAQLIKLMMGPCQQCGHDKIELQLTSPPARTQKGPCLPDFHKNTAIDDGQDPHNDPQS